MGRMEKKKRLGGGKVSTLLEGGKNISKGNNLFPGEKKIQTDKKGKGLASFKPAKEKRGR